MDRQTPAKFHQRLALAAADPEQLVQSKFWHKMSFQHIPLSKADHRSIEYALMLSRDSMSHGDEEVNVNGFVLQFRPQSFTDATSWKTLSFSDSTSTSTPEKTIEAIFVSLGWLVENGIEQKNEFERITNYTVLLNVSTDPISLWLAYDYYPTIDLDMVTTVQLRKSEYFNPDFHSKDPKPVQYNASNPSKTETQSSSRTIRENILRASKLKASIEGHQPVGAKIDPHDLPFMARREILQEYQYTLFLEDKDELLSSTVKDYLQELTRSLLVRNHVRDVLSEDELERLRQFLGVESVATFQKGRQLETTEWQKGSQLSLTQAEEPACHSSDDDIDSIREKDTTSDNFSPKSKDSAKDSGYGSTAGDTLDSMRTITTASTKTTDTEADIDYSSPTESDEVVPGPMNQESPEERGFFDLPEKFDVALIARDIRQWNAEGFTWESVNECLQSSMLHIGPTLHARALPRETPIQRSQFLSQVENS